jgi:hypothetical protein
MVILYSHNPSARLTYISQLLLQEQLGIKVRFTNNPDDCKNTSEPVIWYDKNIPVSDQCLHLIPHGLLNESDIIPQKIVVNDYNSIAVKGKHKPAFFLNDRGDFPFDIFSAAFFLISRYEEYLPHALDEYGRYAHQNSLAFQSNFLSRPLVHEWLQDFTDLLKQKFPTLVIKRPEFRMLFSYDIDQAWSFRGKGFWRNMGGFFRKPDFQRLKVLLGKQKDPFDVFDDFIQLLQQKQNRAVFFFPTANKRSLYDKNTPPDYTPLKQLIQRLHQNYDIGLHPSWKGGDDSKSWSHEKKRLEKITGSGIFLSRQHYIRFRLPETYRTLIEIGLQSDYSMGYGSINGFRASFADSFPWFDLKKNESTSLRIFPFAFMDANSKYEQKQSALETRIELNDYVQTYQQVNGLFIPIFHNFLINELPENQDWFALHNWLTTQIPSST